LCHGHVLPAPSWNIQDFAWACACAERVPGCCFICLPATGFLPSWLFPLYCPWIVFRAIRILCVHGATCCYRCRLLLEHFLNTLWSNMCCLCLLLYYDCLPNATLMCISWAFCYLVLLPSLELCLNF
jgi:hypothetical protein